MKNFKQRVSRLERQTGVKDERYVVIISSADPDPEPFPEVSAFKKHEILPGVLALTSGSPLTSAEREELRAEYAAERAQTAKDEVE